MRFRSYHELTGIDDPAVERQIEHRAFWQVLSATRIVIVVTVVAIVCVTIKKLLLVRFFPAHHDVLTAAIAGFASSHFLIWSLTKKRREARATILLELGRCTNCGYKFEAYQEICAECGNVFKPMLKGIGCKIEK